MTQQVLAYDLMPTLLGLAGIPIEGEMEAVPLNEALLAEPPAGALERLERVAVVETSKPILAVRLRGQTGKLLPARQAVEDWFRDHDGAAPFEGLDDLRDENGRPAAYWVARLRRP